MDRVPLMWSLALLMNRTGPQVLGKTGLIVLIGLMGFIGFKGS